MSIYDIVMETVETTKPDMETVESNMLVALKSMLDSLEYNILNVKRALDHFKPEGERTYQNTASVEEVRDTVGYLINDFWSYPKARQYGTYSEILDVEFQDLSDFLLEDDTHKL